MDGLPTPRLRPNFDYGHLFQAITVVMAFLGIVWFGAGFQTETQVRLDTLADAVTALQKSNDGIRDQLVDTKIQLADIKARLVRPDR